MATVPLSAFHVLAAPSSHRASPPEEEPGALNKPGSRGAAVAVAGTVSPCS